MPVMKGTVTKAASGTHGFDTNTVLSTEMAAAFCQQGFRFCVRYLSRSSPQAGGDLSNAEAQSILAGGLSLMAVQHVPKRGWTPSAALGKQYGQAAAFNARDIVGLPEGIVVWLDLEGVRSGVGVEDVIAYCNCWFKEVAAAGYAPGLYVGAECILDGDELFWRLTTKHYWRSGSIVPDVPPRGYQMVQRVTSVPDRVNANGVLVDIDRNVTMTDAFGGAVAWLSP